VNVVELESEVMQIMMTQLRSKDLSGMSLGGRACCLLVGLTQLSCLVWADQGFVLLAERVAFFVIEHALAALPTKEMVRAMITLCLRLHARKLTARRMLPRCVQTVETVYGHKYTGLAHDDSIKLCGVGVAEDGG